MTRGRGNNSTAGTRPQLRPLCRVMRCPSSPSRCRDHASAFKQDAVPLTVASLPGTRTYFRRQNVAMWPRLCDLWQVAAAG